MLLTLQVSVSWVVVSNYHHEAVNFGSQTTASATANQVKKSSFPLSHRLINLTFTSPGSCCPHFNSWHGLGTWLSHQQIDLYLSPWTLGLHACCKSTTLRSPYLGSFEPSAARKDGSSAVSAKGAGCKAPFIDVVTNHDAVHVRCCLMSINLLLRPCFARS